ncbi:MAG: hypothetical protein ACYSWP_07060 [Planctomycetota bacterium]
MQTGALREKVVISKFLALMCAGLLILAILAGTSGARTEMTPEFFSVDPCSPIVVTHGQSAADIFAPALRSGNPPPPGMCRIAEAFNLDPNDNVDAISVPELFFQEAVATYSTPQGWAANVFFWSIDRTSIGRAMGDVLGASTGIVGSAGSPELTETTTNSQSACGDEFWQIFDQVAPPAQGRMNGLLYEEVDLEETAGVFGANSLDDLDAMDHHCEEDNSYFFSVDPCTAGKYGVSAASVMRVFGKGGAASFVEYYTPEDLGLDPNDDIDALQIWSPYIWPWEAEPNEYWVVLSLAPGSPSLVEAGTGFTWSAADLFLVNRPTMPYPGINSVGDIAGADNRCWVHAEYLSLLPTDNLDAVQVIIADPGAENPQPSDGSGGADPDVELCWDLDFWLSDCNLYLGNDPCNLIYMGSQSGNCFAPFDLLDFCGTYFWRIDVTVDANVYEGDVWSFKVVSELTGDFDCNNIVNFGDLGCMAYNWLARHEDIGALQDGIPDECEFSNITDIAPEGGDGITNFLDYSLFALHWLEELECPCSGNNYDLSGPMGFPDGMVSTYDLFFMAECLTSSGCPPEADYNCDGTVDEADGDHLAAVISCFGPSYTGTNEEAQACCESLP